jgi:ketosteroid isomerase-like protein
MSQANIDLVNRMLGAYARGDIEALLPMLDDDITVRSLLTEAEQSEYRGHPGVRKWLAAVREIFPDWRPEPRQQQAIGDAVVTTLRVTATAGESNVPIDDTFWHAARVRDGKVTWFGFFRTEAEALQAAKTPEP